MTTPSRPILHVRPGYTHERRKPENATKRLRWTATPTSGEEERKHHTLNPFIKERK